MGVGSNAGVSLRRGPQPEVKEGPKLCELSMTATGREMLDRAVRAFFDPPSIGSFLIDDEGFKICNLASKRGWQYTLVPLSVSELVWKWLRNQQPEGPISFIAETQTLNDGTPVLTITLDRA